LSQHRLRRRFLWLRALKLDLGNGENLALNKFVGHGREKHVYKIRGRQEVIGIKKGDRGHLLEEVRNEKVLRKLGIDYAHALRHDPEGKWIIKEYIPEPTVRDLLRSGSEIIFQEPLVQALTVLLDKLSGAGMWMDLGPDNWVLKFKGKTPYLLTLEAPGVDAVDETSPAFESVFLPMWVGYPIPIFMSQEQEQELKARWQRDDAFLFWRKHFGATLPEIDREWDFRQY